MYLFLLILLFIYLICLLLLGVVPDRLKLAKVIPVYKKKSEITSPGNYRPIPLLSRLIFYKLRGKLPGQMLREIYYASIHSHVLYGVEIYANIKPTYLDK